MKTEQPADNQECKLNGCIFFSVEKLSRVLGKIAEEAFVKTGLSPSHAILLYVVNIRGGIQQKEIGELLHLTPSTITRLVEKLKRKGYLDKQSEGKNAYLQTTSEGLAQQDEITASWNHLQDRYKNILSEEEADQFIGSCCKLLESLGDEKNSSKTF